MSLPIGVELWVDGARLADGSDTAADPAAPTVLSDAQTTWGRDTTVDQPEPATLSARILDRGGGPDRADTLVHLGSTAVLWAVAGADRRVVFVGRVTDVQLSWPDSAAGPVLELIAADLLADLANRFVGAEPWPQETLSARANRIVAAVAAGSTVTVDARPAGLPVTRMDVDRQPSATLLRDLAESAAAVAWVIAQADGQPALRIEDPAGRPSLWVFGQGGDGLWRPVPAPAAGRPLDACAVPRDDVTWLRATADLVTRAAVRWHDQATTPDPTERTVLIVDTAAEATWGARGLSLSTVLATDTAATGIANLLLASHPPSPAWRVDGLSWDTDATTDPADPDSLALALDLLDNTTRFGLPITVAPLPAWPPAGGDAGLYVEGGTYTFGDGRWVLDLVTSSAAGAGDSITYQDTPRAATYATVAPDVSYLALVGVGAPPTAAELAPADPAGPAVETRGHTNDYGFPVPDPTDPYCDTPAALQALADAVAPRLANLPIWFEDMKQYVLNSPWGMALLDYRSRFSAIGGVLACADAAAPYGGNIMQWVTLAADTPGTMWIRAMNVPPPESPAAGGAPLVSLLVWGTPA